jgi:hypothetical protein
MVLSDNLIMPIAQCVEEVLVGLYDHAIQRKGYDSLYARDCGDLGCMVCRFEKLRCHIGGNLDDADRTPGRIQDGIVAGLDPDFAPAIAKASEGCRVVFATAKCRPKFAVLSAGSIGWVAEYRMVLANDLVESVTHRAQEVFVGADYRPIKPKFYNCLATVEGIQTRTGPPV